MSQEFPFSAQIKLRSDLQVHYQLVLNLIGPLLTPPRRAKIDKVISERNFANAIVLEGIYDRGNVSAVMRTAEGFGLVNFHVIETGERFKEANRVTQGADKWTEVTKWSNTTSAVKHLKDRGHRIIVTHLEAATPLDSVDFSIPTALVLGNEKSGASPEMLELADERVIIPMSGFVQSFNISVAGALCIYEIYQSRMRKNKRAGSLSYEEQEILKAHYYLRSLESAESILTEQLSRQ